MLKLLFVFLGVAALALVGAVFLVIWIAGQTPIHVTESESLPETPPAVGALVQQGAEVAVSGEVATVHQPEWTTSDGSRPGTPWGVSAVPDDHWIQTPVTLDVAGDVMILQPDAAAESDLASAADELRFVVRGGEVEGDSYAVDDGTDRQFEEGERVLLVLGRAEENGPHGDEWELIRKYTVTPDGTAVLVWGEDEYVEPVDEVLAEFRAASQ